MDRWLGAVAAVVLLAWNAGCGGSDAPVSISIIPRSDALSFEATRQFTADVTGTSNVAVAWAVVESAVGGTIDVGGLYRAPSTPGTFHVTVTSVADTTKTATATVDVGPAPVVDASIVPADRRTLWNPGLNAVGGIPARNTIFRTISPRGSGLDDTPQIQAALDACPSGQVVKLNAGTFVIGGEGLAIGRSNVTLRGSGPAATRLVKPTGTNFPVVIIGTRWASTKQPVALTADAVKGTRTLTAASNPGYRVGELLVLNELTDSARTWWGPNCSPGAGSYPDCRLWFTENDRPIGQVLQVQRVSGNEVTFSTPFHIDFRTARQAHLLRFDQTTQVEWSGVEDLYVSNGEGGDGGGNIHVWASAHCWVKNVESANSIGTSVNLEGTFRCEVRDSYLHSTREPNPGGGGYGLGVNFYAADNLLENNVVWNFNKVMVMRASGGGNVVGYNYMQDGYGAGYPTIPEVGLNGSHMATPHMELFEGNESWNFTAETYWGNSIYLTVFRNSLTGLRLSKSPLRLSDQNGRHAAGLSNHCWWFTYMGNVLGYSGMPLNAAMPAGNTGQTVWKYERAAADGDNVAAMWWLGDADATTRSRTIRHGNFDWVDAQVKWETGRPTTLPASLYLPGKPAFFGANPWPWVDPVTGAVSTLPAKARFDALP